MQTALITGATGGIGYELCKQFIKHNYNLVLTSRHENKLKIAQQNLTNMSKNKCKIDIFNIDLNQKEAPQKIYDYVKSKNIQIDVLVNNAGFGSCGPFHATDIERELNLIQVNICIITHLTKLFIKDMVKRKSGKILNVSSTGAFQPGPYMAVYFASKSYILSFSEALRSELKPYGISVTALCPGPTATPFISRAKGCGQSRIFKNLLSPFYVASVGFDSLINNKAVAIVGLKNKLLYQLTRILPRSVVRGLSKHYMSKGNVNYYENKCKN